MIDLFEIYKYETLISSLRGGRMVSKFYFSNEIIEKVSEQINEAEKSIRIAIFQIHHIGILDSLNEKLKEGVSVELFTLPLDSIHDEGVKKKIGKKLDELKENGGQLHFCGWNVGDPGRTTTAVGRWYSFHGKIIVTEKCAIALSANLFETPELDAAIVIKENEEIINDFNLKIDLLKELFTIPNNEYQGNIREKIEEYDEDENIFKLPDNIDDKYRKLWINHYPVELCPEEVDILEGLYITPFNCRGREFFMDIIDEAEEFVYISSESFTDVAFANFLVKVAIEKDIEIRILCGISSMDFTDRVNKMLRELLAQNIKIRKSDNDLHAKIIITDKHLVVSSINLNKINLGFHPKKKYWRENTETIYVSQDAKLIQESREKFNEVYGKCTDVKEKLAEKLRNTAKHIFSTNYGLTSTTEAKNIFAKRILDSQIDIIKETHEIGRYVHMVSEKLHKKRVDKDLINSALILHSLSKCDMTLRELENEISSDNLEPLLQELLQSGLVSEENGYYKLNL